MNRIGSPLLTWDFNLAITPAKSSIPVPPRFECVVSVEEMHHCVDFGTCIPLSFIIPQSVVAPKIPAAEADCDMNEILPGYLG